MDKALRGGQEERHNPQRFGKRSEGDQSAQRRHERPHSMQRYANKRHQGAQKAADRAREYYRRPNVTERSDVSGSQSSDSTMPQPWNPSMWSPSSMWGGNGWGNSPWSMSPRSDFFGGQEPQSSWGSMMEDFENRMNEFEKRFGAMEDDSRGMNSERSMLAPSGNDDEGQGIQEYNADMDPFSMMQDYLKNRSQFSNTAATWTPGGQWQVNEEGQLVLSAQLPKWMEAKDVRLDLEDGCLRLSGKREHREHHEPKGTKAKSSAQYNVSFRYEWPLDPALKEKDIHAHFDSSEGALEVAIDVPPNSSLNKLLSRGDLAEEDQEAEGQWIRIPISKSVSRDPAEKEKSVESQANTSQINRSENEGMVEHAKQGVEQAAKQGTEAATAKVKDLGSKAKGLYRDAKDKAGEVMETAKEKTSEAVETVKDKASETFQNVTAEAKSKAGPYKKQSGSSTSDPQAPFIDEM